MLIVFTKNLHVFRIHLRLVRKRKMNREIVCLVLGLARARNVCQQYQID